MYGDSSWKDLLTSYNGGTINYDGIGNPTKWYDGTSFTWVNGRRLASAVNSSTGVNNSYTYDADGLRLTKTVNGVQHKYVWQGSQLVAEYYGGTELEFFYDESGAPYAFSYKASASATPVMYYYVTNLQGDVTNIVDASGNVNSTYTYNAWGKLIFSAGTMSAINPIRYRGYYYDSETGLYYLQSRYYDPEICRFVNADSYASTGQGISGTNMFTYCLNAPVNRVDYAGQFGGTIGEIINSAFSAIKNAIGSAPVAYAVCGGVAAIDGPLPFGDVVAGLFAVLLTAEAIRSAHSVSKAEEKDEAIPAPQPKPTVIYRYGGTNPGNLTPRSKDKDTGLSFSTTPRAGAAVTTIEALNATGVVYAVKDGITHVSVRPVGATVEDWINAGSGSVWTQAVKSVVIKWG